jgi:hypothetical protein
MDQSSTIGRAVMGFVAGALSVVTFMSAAWLLARAGGYVPANAPPLWAMDPRVAPWGVPRVANLLFWGGLWGLVLNLLFRGLSGVGYWLAWLLAGAIAVAAVAIFVVPAIKGQAFAAPSTQRLMVSGFLNGVFGLGIAIWLQLFSRFTR